MTRRSEALAFALAILAAGSACWVGALPPGVETQVADSRARWSALSPEQRARAASRAQAWDALPPAERARQRGRYQAWRALDEGQRAQLRAAAQAFAGLPAEEQARLRTLYDHLDASQQRGWELGPGLGADWPRLQPLFAYVPVDERAALLALLRQSDTTQRDDLAALAQRIPPQERAAFLRALLRIEPARRGEWLHQRRNQ